MATGRNGIASPRSTAIATALVGVLTASVLGQTSGSPTPATPPSAPPMLLAQTLNHVVGASNVVIPQARSFSAEPARAGVRIEAVNADVAIREQTASTTLDIALVNTSARQEQAVLLLPVPDGAVVSAFAFDGAASEPTAQVLGRDEARRLYDSIVSQLLDPALLEFAGYNLVRSSVFPVPPNGRQRIRLTYESLLESDGDRVDYLLPRSESLSYGHPWRISVAIESQHPISTVYSPSHECAPQRTAANAFRVQLAQGAASEPGAFRLSYLVDRGGVSGSLFAYPDPSIGGGYFLFMAGLPAQADAEASRRKREVTVVIDRSGSMAGQKMDQVRAAALQVIEGLADGEAFNIIDYSTTVAAFAPRPVVKDVAVTLDARQYLASIRPGGGTNIHDALVEALRQPATDGMLPIVLFLTDGLPTIGRTSEVAIRRMVVEGNPHARRVFTFGVGQDVNAPLLDRVAESTRARSSYVLPDEDVEIEVARVFKRLYGPVFAAPRIRTTDTGGNASTRLIWDLIPGELPDLFEGDQLILLGRYREGSPITLHLEGEYLGERTEFPFSFSLDTATTRNAFVPRLWASRRIAFLIDELRQAGAASSDRPRVVGATIFDDLRYRELVDEILRLSTEFGILTEYTAFLATEGTDLTNWSEMTVGCINLIDERAVRTRSGLGALNQAGNIRKSKGQVALNYKNAWVDRNLKPVECDAVQQVCDRAFFRRGNRWIDSRLLAISDSIEPDEVLMIGSPAHFALLRRFAAEGRQGLLSLSGEVLLTVDGRIVLLTDGC